MNDHPHVTRDLAARYVVRGTHVPVRRLWYWHRRGVLIETLVKHYPKLGWAAVLDALSFAYDNAEVMEAELADERGSAP